MNAPPLTDPFTIAGLEVPNRVVLAPLAGIGNWFVRLQAKRYGAGLTVSEMISSFAIHHRNEKTMRDLLMIHDSEREYPGPIAFQLFGQDPEVMRSAAATAAEQGADIIDLNMGCPVPKVMKNGAGAALISDPAVAVEIARAAAEGSGLPVTVKLRSGQKKGEADGFQLALRLVDEAGVAAIAFHPRSAQVHHKGSPDYELAAKLVDQLPVPVILSGGMSDNDATFAAGLATRGSSNVCSVFATRRRRGPRSWPSWNGSSIAPSSISATSARRATCGPSIRGISINSSLTRQLWLLFSRASRSTRFVRCSLSSGR